MTNLKYDPEERRLEKQRAREADRQALESGQKTQEDLIRENSFVRAGRAKIDFSKIPSIRKLSRLAQAIQVKTGISSGKSEDIAEAVIRGRDVRSLAVQKSWPTNAAGDIEGPKGTMSFSEVEKLGA